ncbi:MAG TPA: transglutaminase-like domain-containing protein, partial [Lachnospiraceae bacterium]|nr:transglutaminase-like domain-containing protein [Lachnospiraceae bacterium]
MRKGSHILSLTLCSMVFLADCCGCGNEMISSGSNQVITTQAGTAPSDSMSYILGDEPSPSSDVKKGSRDNTPSCLVPTADGTAETHNDIASIDFSHASDGYIMARYIGSSPKVKMQIKGEGAITYTYNLVSDDFEAFPLSAGSTKYDILILENISDTSYLTCLTESIDVTLGNEFGPYLYPNQYCRFSSDNETVKKAEELAETASTDLDVVTNVYNYIISHIAYDYDKAETVPSGYTTDVDEILESGTGICLDYAAVMTSMLRSQRIPTRLEVGYVGDAYHAWISTYITDIGWVNGIVKFDGKNWELMDPTFAANSGETELREYIGDGSNYIVKYIY